MRKNFVKKSHLIHSSFTICTIFCYVYLFLMYSWFHQEVHFLPPEMADLCNINSNRKWMDISLNGYRKDFKSLWGPNGTWDQEMVILINDKHIAVSEIQSGVKKCTSGWNTLYVCIASEILKWQSTFLYNLSRLNDFIG